MKKRTWIAVLAALALALTLAGCGSSANSAYFTGDMKQSSAPTASAPSLPESNGYSYGQDQMAYDPAQPEMTTGSQLPANVKMIYTANLQMETTEFDRATAELTALVNRLGGYFENSGISSYGSGYRSADYTVRIPAQSFDTFCTDVGTLCKINRINRSAEDVSEAYYDVESRLATQRTKLERLQNLLAQAEDMEDIITLESAISDTELQIERLTGSLRKYDSLVGYATIYIGLQEVYKVSPDEAPAIGFWAKLGAAFRTGRENLVDGAEDLGRLAGVCHRGGHRRPADPPVGAASEGNRRRTSCPPAGQGRAQGRQARQKGGAHPACASGRGQRISIHNKKTPAGWQAFFCIKNQNRPVILPFSSTSIFSAAGT